MEQEALVDAAIEDLHAALSAARALLAALASGSGSEEATAQTAAQLQQTYLHSTGELRKKMLTLAERSSASRQAQQPDTGQTKDNDALIAELQQRKQQLIQQVDAASEFEAELMVRLRGLLDTFTLWDAHKRHLDAPPHK